MATAFRIVSKSTIAVAFVSLSSPAAPQVFPGINTSYALVETALTVNEPVLVKFSVENGLAEAVLIDVRLNDHGYGGFRATIERPDGRTEEGPKRRTDELVSGTTTSVGPFASFSKVILANKWFDFDVPGRYFLDIETTQPFVTQGGVTLPLPARGRLTIEVGPRDPTKLRQICDDLTRKALNSPSAPEGLEAAEALSKIRDPIAVPFMDQALEQAPLWWMMIRGLERIADTQAVDRLIAHLDSPSLPIREEVHDTLLAIERKTEDDTIRKRINAVIRK